MAHVESIENNRLALLRCININVLIVAGLREEGVIDDAKESRLEAEKAHHDKVCLLIDWIKESSDIIYESFLQVMEENEQKHVANLLRGNVEDNHLPLSLARHARLLKIRRKLMHMIHNNADLIAALKGSGAISQTDAEDLSVDKGPNYKKNFHLINAILRRSDHSFECLHDALRDTHQPDVADYLKEGEVIPVHATTSRPDLDEVISELINAHLNSESMDETTVKEIQMPHTNGLIIVGATPGHSIVIFVYCKTTDNMVTFTQLFNSGELQTKLEDILNRLFARIEPKSTERFEARIRLDDEDILEIEEITGIEDWMKCEQTKSPQSGCLLTSHKPIDVEAKTTKEMLSATSCKPDLKQENRTFCENFESLLTEEEELLNSFLPETASSEKGQIWIERRNMLSQGLEKLLASQTYIFKILLSTATSCEGRAWTGELKHVAQNIDSKLKQQQLLWKNLEEQVLDERRESILSTFRPNSSLQMSHADAIQKNYDVLLRCTAINLYVIDYLRAEDVLDEDQHHELKTERNPLKQRILLFQWLKDVSSDKYESFLQVMKDSEQEHVANLLTGFKEEDHLPLSDVRYTRLEKIRHKLATCIHTDDEVIARLISLNAISMIDAEEIKEDKSPYAKSSKLISAIMRRSNHSYNSLQDALRESNQAHAAEFLSVGEVITVHVDSSRPDLDEFLSKSKTDDAEFIQDLFGELTGSSLNPVKVKLGQTM